MAETNTTGDKVALVDFANKGDGDQIADEVMAELVRRLAVSIEESDEKVLFRGVNPPTDTSLLWQPVDENNIPIGSSRVYDPATNTWVSTADEPAIVISNKGYISINSDTDTVITLPNQHPSADYHVSLTPTTYNGTDYTGTFDSGAVYTVTNRQVGAFQITTTGVTGTLLLLWETQS